VLKSSEIDRCRLLNTEDTGSKTTPSISQLVLYVPSDR
jgi:hypothetical protein